MRYGPPRTMREAIGRSQWDAVHAAVYSALPRFEWVRVSYLVHETGISEAAVRKHLISMEHQGRAQRRVADNGIGQVWRRRP